MTRILLVRHGATDQVANVLTGRTPGIHLNAEGRKDTVKLRERLSHYGRVAAILSGPMERALETAELLATAHGIRVEIDHRFDELDFGIWKGKTFVELIDDPVWGEYNQCRSAHGAPAGESLVEVQSRAWKGIRSLRERFGNSTVIVVSHADVIRSILMLALGVPLDNVLRLDVPPASISELSVGAGAPVVHGISIF